MSGNGNNYDTATAVAFFKTFEGQLLWRGYWFKRRVTALAIIQYINGVYTVGVNTRFQSGKLAGLLNKSCKECDTGPAR